MADRVLITMEDLESAVRANAAFEGAGFRTTMVSALDDLRSAVRRADPARSYLQAFFVEPWRAALSGRPRTETLAVDAAGILVMDDQPELVDRKFAEFVESAGK